MQDGAYGEVVDYALSFDFRAGRSVDPQLKSAIEGALIKWVHLIDEVINEIAVKSKPGEYPGPLVEVSFL